MFISISYIANKDHLYDNLINLYLERIRWKVTLNALAQKKHSISLSVTEKQRLDTSLLLKNIQPESKVFILDKGGAMLSTDDLFLKLSKETKPIQFIIGGNDGFIQEDILPYEKISLSKMTFTLNMSIAILIEQIYRSFTLSQNIPYHK